MEHQTRPGRRPSQEAASIPSCASARGRELSMTTSTRSISSARRTRPSGSAKSRATLSLPWFSRSKKAAGPWRAPSGRDALSSFVTRAPARRSRSPHSGPAHSELKSSTQGYGSFDYEVLDYRPTDLVKIDILVNGESVDALSQLAHREGARKRALHYCDRLAETIPKHQFKIAIQGAIGGKIIARSNIASLRKDVTAKCYGGDITRKRKLLEKQKEGKKRMKTVGAVDIPQEAFVAVLKTDTDS